MGKHNTCPYIGWIPCRGNPRGCLIVGRFSKIDIWVSRYEYRPTQTQQTGNYPGGLEQMERRSPFPTNDSVLCRGRGFRREQRSLLPTTAKCQHALVRFDFPPEQGDRLLLRRDRQLWIPLAGTTIIIARIVSQLYQLLSNELKAIDIPIIPFFSLCSSK